MCVFYKYFVKIYRQAVLVTCLCFAMYLYWIQYEYHTPVEIIKQPVALASDFQNNGTNHFRSHKKQNKLSTNLKYMLLWNAHDYFPFNYFEEGQQSFIKYNCSVINCFITAKRTYFNGDITKFDAIAFNGRALKGTDLPNKRTPHQKYIYFNTESADNYPICDAKLDNFFNWTSTYKLNSDIPFPYIVIKNNQGKVIGPHSNMRWSKESSKVGRDLEGKLAHKTKAAAWFVSKCTSRSKREQFVKSLQKALAPYNLTVDVYGNCGLLECPRFQEDVCNSLLARYYFFYLSLENSFAEDYVTEKLLIALQHDTVPIVFGGANYSRFLPPGSYIDWKTYSTKQLAARLHKLMIVPERYARFFRWKSQYTYSNASMENVCALCAAMNSRMFDTVSIYDQFRKWWNPNYKAACRKIRSGKY